MQPTAHRRDATLPPPVCPYCGEPAVHRPSSAHLYRRDYGPVWECAPCKAWVGCHKANGGMAPLGRLADAALRAAKVRAHAAFDPLWQAKMRVEGCSKHEARGKGYRWLARTLGLTAAECHIALFDVETCARVVEVCEAGRAAVRASRRGEDPG